MVTVYPDVSRVLSNPAVLSEEKPVKHWCTSPSVNISKLKMFL